MSDWIPFRDKVILIGKLSPLVLEANPTLQSPESVPDLLLQSPRTVPEPEAVPVPELIDQPQVAMPAALVFEPEQ